MRARDLLSLAFYYKKKNMDEELLVFYGGTIIVSNLLIWLHLLIPRCCLSKFNLIEERNQCFIFSGMTFFPIVQLTIIAMAHNFQYCEHFKKENLIFV